jgi:AcrR family transcriptional regulator
VDYSDRMTNKKTAIAPKTRIRNPALTRARLLQATVEILAQKGPDGLSLKDAASLANVSRGVAYQHFEDREHLLREAEDWITARLLESIQAEAVADPDEVLLSATRLILQNRDAASLLIADAMAGRDLSPKHPINRLIRQSLERMQAAGEARADLDIDILSYIFLGMTSTLVMLSRLPDSDPEELAQRFAREFAAFMEQGVFTAAKRKTRRRQAAIV